MRLSMLDTGSIPALALAIFIASPAAAAPCGDGPGGFAAWKQAFTAEAIAAGISPAVAESALAGVTYNPTVIKFDRSQRSFKLSFEQFYARRVNDAMIAKGRRFLRENAAMIADIERRYSVPGPVLVAIWALESGFGRDSGNLSVIRSLATLAYDCRRSDFFTRELLAALEIVDRGEMTPARMRGAWAGEIGQTQFLATRYITYAVDHDGDGRRDLMRSVPDVLASTANYLSAAGWRRGEGWGPGTANDRVLNDWNRADVYRKTIATLADKLAQP